MQKEASKAERRRETHKAAGSERLANDVTQIPSARLSWSLGRRFSPSEKEQLRYPPIPYSSNFVESFHIRVSVTSVVAINGHLTIPIPVSAGRKAVARIVAFPANDRAESRDARRITAAIQGRAEGRAGFLTRGLEEE